MAYQCLHNLGGPPSEWLRVMRGIAGIRQTNFFNCKSVPRRVKRAELAHERTAANTIYNTVFNNEYISRTRPYLTLGA